MTYKIILSLIDKSMIVKVLCFCFQRLSTWTTINTNGVDVVIPNIEPLDVAKEEAYTIGGSIMSHRYFHMNMKKILKFYTL